MTHQGIILREPNFSIQENRLFQLLNQ